MRRLVIVVVVVAIAALVQLGRQLHSWISDELFWLYVFLHQYTQKVPEEVVPAALAAQQVKLVTLETRTNDSGLMMPGVPGKVVLNVGATVPTLDSWKTRALAYQQWLLQEAAQDPEKLAILTDAADVAFGGCDEAQLVASYNVTVAASGGARVIFGAEFGGWPKASVEWGAYEKFKERRLAVIAAHGLEKAPYDEFVDCGWLSGYCPTKAYEFLNAGFMMGPVGMLLRSLEGLLEELKEVTNYQLAAHRVLLKRPEEVTLDYSGGLVLNIGHFARGSVGPVVSAEPGEPGRIWNKVLNRTACYIHGQSVSGKLHVNNVTWLLFERRGYEPKFPLLERIWG